MPNIQLANNLRHLRKLNHLTQIDLSEMLNISRQAYSNYETSKRTPDLDTLLQLCRFYSITLNDLVLGNLREELFSANGVAESMTPYSVATDKNTGNNIYLSKEETDMIINFRTLSKENRQIITGFLKANSSD